MTAGVTVGWLSTIAALINPGDTGMYLQNVKDILGIDPAVLPRGQWDIRNFGWSPTGGKNPAVPTVTRRAANETAAVAAFINSELLPK